MSILILIILNNLFTPVNVTDLGVFSIDGLKLVN